MNVSLIKIRSFIAVGESKSFRVASEKLNLSQPAISTHVKDLEDSLGLPLLRRTTRSVNLTTEGENFMIRARRALLDLEDVIEDLKEQAALKRGRVSIGCVPSLASLALPGILSIFNERYPDIKVQIYDEFADKLYVRTLNDEIDLMIGPEPPGRIRLEFTHIFDDQYVAIVPANHALARRSSVRIKDLMNDPFLLLTSPTNVRIVMEKAFDDAGQELVPKFEASNPYTIGGMIQAGLGITALPEMILPSMMNSRLKSIPIARPRIVRRMGTLTRMGEFMPPAASVFADTVMREFKRGI